MKFIKTFLLVLITALLAISKTGYASAFAGSSSTTEQVAEDVSSDELSNHLSFKSNHHALDNPLIEMDEQEDESEDNEEKKSSQELIACSVPFKAVEDFAPLCLGCTSSFKGIAQMQSIRLHLVIEKIQV